MILALFSNSNTFGSSRRLIETQFEERINNSITCDSLSPIHRLYNSEIFQKYFSYGLPLSIILEKKLRNLALKKVKLSDKILEGIETILCPTGNLLLLSQASSLKDQYNLRWHVAFHDLPSSYFFNKRIKKYVREQARAIISNCDSGDFISLKMKKFFDFKKPFVITYGTRNKYKLIGGIKNIKCAKNLAFIGNIRFKRELIDLCNYLEKNHEGISVHLFTPFRIRKKNIINHGYIEREMLENILKQMDYGLIVMPLSKTKSDVANYSFPSKIFDYINAHLPVLTFSNKTTEISEFVNKYGIGKTFNNIEEFGSILNEKNKFEFKLAKKALNARLKELQEFHNQI